MGNRQPVWRPGTFAGEHRAAPATLLAALMIVVSAALLPSATSRDAEAQTDIALESFEHFTLQYSQIGTGTTLQLTEGDAYAQFYLPYGPYLLSLWSLRIPGVPAPQNEVLVGLFNDPIRLTHFAGFAHLAGLSSQLRVDFIEQRFELKLPRNKPLSDYRFFLPKVYGPTFYAGDLQTTVVEAYPTFLETQIVGIEDIKDGGALCFTTTDDNGLRKRMGFIAGARPTDCFFVVRYIPEQGETNPLPFLWLPPYEVQYGYRLPDLNGVANWFRTNQYSRATSFLSKRSLVGQHPDVTNARFAVAVGASASSIQLPGGQYDVSQQYRTDVLDYFGGLHGSGMQLYHLGWHRTSPGQAPVIPEGFDSITPGHLAFIQQASMTSLARSVCYTLPGVLHPNSPSYSPSLIRLEKNGSLASMSVPDWPGQTYYSATYMPQQTTNVYTSLYVNSILQTGRFHGAYLDALSPWPLSYSHFRDAHPFQRNEQVVGMDRLVSAIKAGVLGRRGFDPIIFNETPHDCLQTDASAIDLNNFDPDYFNIFRSLVSGSEWPVYSVVYGWDDFRNQPSGAAFVRELANCLAGGARPIILWPEMLNVFPTDPRDDPEFDSLRALLSDYIKDWASFWRSIIEGRRLVPLDPAAIAGPYLNPSFTPFRQGDPATAQWRLPGRRLSAQGGSELSSLRGRSSRAFFTGVFEPREKPGQRAVVIYRWTDPRMARAAGLPLSHPLHRPDVTAELTLSPQALSTRPGATLSVLDVATGKKTPIGRLAAGWQQSVQCVIPLEECGAKAIIIE